MGKFGKELRRIGQQVEKITEHAADQADAISLRAQLSDERNRAQTALESAEKAATDVQQLIIDVQTIFTKAEAIVKPTPAETTELSEEVSAQFQLADEKFKAARKSQQALKAAQQIIQEKLQIVRDNRGILSPSNQEPVSDHTLQSGRMACAIAEQSASDIQGILAQAHLDSESCKVALTEYHSLMIGGNPKAVNQFLLGKMREMQAELAQLKLMQQAATSSPISGEHRDMLLQQQSMTTAAVTASSASSPVVTHRRSLSNES